MKIKVNFNHWFIILMLLFVVSLSACTETVEVYDIEGEYGIAFDINRLSVLLDEPLSELEYEPIDTFKIGTKRYTFYAGKKTYYVDVHIVDTQAPQIQGIDLFIIKQDETLNIVDYLEAYDVIDGDIAITLSEFDTNELGSHTIMATATDKHNNETSKPLRVVVKDASEYLKGAASMDEVLFVDEHIIANKRYGLPSNYAPGEDPEAGAQIRKLIKAMRGAGLRVANSYSGYRSYQVQKTLYTNYIASHGQVAADTFSARPGHSEHQTGLTFDLRQLSGSLLTSEPEISWVRDNAHEFGFIVRYPKGKEHITGYTYEPWHLRYMGQDARAIYESGQTLEEFYKIPN